MRLQGTVDEIEAIIEESLPYTMTFAVTDSIFYITFGIFLTLFFQILSKKEKKSQEKSKKLYINIFFFDRREVVRNIIRSKISRNRPFIRALAKRAAVALLANEIVSRIGNDLASQIPQRFSFIGLNSKACIAYIQTGFLCIELTVESIDLHRFVELNGSKEKADNFMSLLEKYSLPFLTQYFEKFLLNFLVNKISNQLPTNIKDKLMMKMNAEVEVLCCNEKEQGPVLLNVIQQLNAKSTTVTLANEESS